MSRLPRPKYNRLYKIAAVILFLNGLVCLRSLQLLGISIERVVASRETVSTVDSLYTSIKDADIGVREFLLTGTPQDRAVFNQQLYKLTQTFDMLVQRSKGDRLFEAQVLSLKHVASERNEQLQMLAEIRSTEGPVAAARAFQAQRGEKISNELLRLVLAILKEQDQGFLNAVNTARVEGARTFLTVVLASVVALLLLGVVFYVNRREIARREGAAEAIREREEWFSATLSSISDAVIATDDMGRIRLINPIAQSLTGWGQAESKGRPLARSSLWWMRFRGHRSKIRSRGSWTKECQSGFPITPCSSPRTVRNTPWSTVVRRSAMETGSSPGSFSASGTWRNGGLRRSS